MIFSFPYVESFESGGPDGSAELPSEWTIVNNGTNSPLNLGFVMNSKNSHTGTRNVIVSATPSISLEAWMISPEILFEKGEAYSIRISYRTGSNGGAAAFIGIGDEPTSDSIEQNLLWNISSVDNQNYNEVEIPYTHLGGDSKYVGVVVNSLGGRTTENIFDTFIIEKQTLSNQDFEKDFVSIVPNPVSDFFELKLKKVTNKVSLAIYNNLGKLIMKKENLKVDNLINVSSISSGLYFVKIEDNNGSSLIKKISIK